MRLLDLIEQEHAVRMLHHAIGKQAALVETDIARRCADQPGDGMPLHIFRHVEAQQLDAHDGGELAGHLGLADAGRAGEEVRADWLVRFAQASPGELDRRRKRLNGFILAVDNALEVRLKILQRGSIVLGDLFRRNAGDLGDDRLDLAYANLLAAAAFRDQPLRRARFVDHVDGLVRQLAVGDVAGRQFDSRLDRFIRVPNAVELLEGRLEAGEDLDGVRHGRLNDIDLAEPAG